MRIFLIRSIVIVSVAAAVAAVLAGPFEDASFAPASVRLQALKLARWSAERKLKSAPVSSLPFKPTGMLARPAPCFVTIDIDGIRRGCTGSFEPMSNSLAHEIVQTTARAMSIDPRSKPITSTKLARARFSVTIPGRRMPVRDSSAYPPGVWGLLVEQSGRSGVMLPGEAKTAHWRLKEARRQAGLPPDADVHQYVFKAVTWQESR